ncbi:hypothetical protein K2173_027286 [Erythroxylum novogranatense]|uniref:Pectinesterase inhibitor domain-containing protein n=1 Tax=Erythroxylum novogranatense TaxID=1862640 RepID=A0AAV8U1V7_9ROSI|nr:hypothetical protein K2173_027286 [Erythroxylum novogranatense]
MNSMRFSVKSHFLNFLIYVSLTIFFASQPCLAQTSETHSNSSNDFIRTACGVTRYPEICYQSLSAYAQSIKTDPFQLANVALSVTMKEAQNTSTTVTKLLLESQNLTTKETNAIRDCVENMKGSVSELKQSLVAMEDLKGPDFEMQISNIQTWVSAALTNEDTCMDGFEGKAMNGKIKDTLSNFIEKVAQLTSNALALINKLY